MNPDVYERIHEEMERLRRRYAPVIRTLPDSRELPAHWTLGDQWLRWHVVLEDVLEPDIDIEIEPHCLILRAQHFGTILVSVLPVPEGFDANGSRIRCETGYLEVRVRRTQSAPPVLGNDGP